MSVTREVTVWCDGCMEWDQRSGTRATDLRRELKAKGWTRTKVDGEWKDYCPECSRKRKT
jgi:hypothetical protein